MRAFIVLSCLAFAAARPEPPSGYSYSRPGGGGGVISGGHSSGLGGISSGFGSSGFGIGHSGSSFGSSFNSGSSGASFGGAFYSAIFWKKIAKNLGLDLKCYKTKKIVALLFIQVESKNRKKTVPKVSQNSPKHFDKVQ